MLNAPDQKRILCFLFTLFICICALGFARPDLLGLSPKLPEEVSKALMSMRSDLTTGVDRSHLTSSVKNLESALELARAPGSKMTREQIDKTIAVIALTSRATEYWNEKSDTKPPKPRPIDFPDCVSEIERYVNGKRVRSYSYPKFSRKAFRNKLGKCIVQFIDQTLDEKPADTPKDTANDRSGERNVNQTAEVISPTPASDEAIARTKRMAQQVDEGLRNIEKAISNKVLSAEQITKLTSTDFRDMELQYKSAKSFQQAAATVPSQAQ